MSFDERSEAEITANLLKTEHYEVVAARRRYGECITATHRHLEDLRVGQCYPNYYVARLASKFVKAVLSGAGGDELIRWLSLALLPRLGSTGPKITISATTNSGSGSLPTRTSRVSSTPKLHRRLVFTLRSTNFGRC